ncbi:hypothetical protein RVR_5003 [Actinacidiphila reveromycinica]|uniref:Protein kinase domain-containing protein n=1 Tax=Actinacidiphila reveromycinica TaxID=659352 RepID=A0A7U3UTV0_9ACTN|nr:hypothetical protein RVR_5003 [Streptomyces sp. SN-593]
MANEGGEGSSSARQGGATPDGTTTDEQTGGTAEDTTAQEQPDTKPAAEAIAEPSTESTGQDTVQFDAATDEDPDTAEPTQPIDAVSPAGTARASAGAATKPAPTSGRESGARPAAKSGAKPGAGAGGGTATTTATKAAAPATPAPAPAAAAAGAKPKPKPRIAAPDLHSGHKLARRYQLAECVTRVDGFSSWRAVDEKLRRAVGVHVLPADHPQARPVMAAARSAALLGDPRFVQVLDAVEDSDLVYVIHEWLPDATSLADLLRTGPLEPHEAYQMVSQVSQGMAAAHREGLAHLRLDPGAVLRTVSGQYRIRGLAVAAALRGLTSEQPRREDTEAIGALLYAALTQRWPYEEDAHGLTGLPKGVGLIAPDQVRAGVHRGLSEIAMRALANDGATASREEPPCTTPEELAKVVAGIPRVRPPEQPSPAYGVAALQRPPAPPGAGATRQPTVLAGPPPALPGRTGQALKWAVAALLIVAIGLGSWQLADTLQSREGRSATPTPTSQKGGQAQTHPSAGPIPIVTVKDYDPFGSDGDENPTKVKLAYDGNASTAWETSWYADARFGNLKSGVGLILDLGSAKTVSDVKVDFVGQTSVDLMAAPAGTTTMPTDFSTFTKVANGSGTEVTLTPSSKVSSRFLLVWLTSLPPISDGHFRGEVSEVHVTGS